MSRLPKRLPKLSSKKLHDCTTCQEAKVFAFSFEREAMILGVGYSTQVFAGHYYTVVVAIIYTALACRPAVKAARNKRTELAAKREQLAVELATE